MSVTVESSRFGELQVAERDIVEFPLGLVGLPGSRYAFVDRNPSSGFRWLHSIKDPRLALPVVDPRLFFPSFTLDLADEDRACTGVHDASAWEQYVTVRATPDPAEITVNLRAPLVIREGLGYQVINVAPGAELRAPLFAHAADQGSAAVDAA